jgi:hypothetical protein
MGLTKGASLTELFGAQETCESLFMGQLAASSLVEKY